MKLTQAQIILREVLDLLDKNKQGNIEIGDILK